MTEYYCFARPITSIRLDEEGPNTKVTIFVRGENAGTIVLRKEEVSGFTSRLHEEQPAATTFAHCAPNWNGNFADDVWLISEYGNICQVRDLR